MIDSTHHPQVTIILLDLQPTPTMLQFIENIFFISSLGMVDMKRKNWGQFRSFMINSHVLQCKILFSFFKHTLTCYHLSLCVCVEHISCLKLEEALDDMLHATNNS
jgi:hypothetical protein